MKHWMIILIVVSIIVGCSPSNSKVFSKDSSLIEKDFLQVYFSGEIKARSKVKKKITDLEAEISSIANEGRANRKYDTKIMGDISPYFCDKAEKPRKKLAELKLLNNSEDMKSWQTARNLATGKIDTLPAAIEAERAKLEESVSDNDIARELADLLAQDQAYNVLIHWKNLEKMDDLSKNYLRSMRSIEVCNFKIKAEQALSEIFQKTNGWPVISKYGKDADHAAFVVMHNISHNLDLLENSLETIEKLYPIGETQKWHYPNLFDIVANYNDRPQKFGWIIRCREGRFVPYPPLEDREKVNDYRAEFGLTTLEHSLKRFPKNCGTSISK